MSRTPLLNTLSQRQFGFLTAKAMGGLTDRLVVLSQSNYETYLNILHPVLTTPSQLASAMSGKSNWNLERFISFSLARAKSKVKLFPYTAFTVREWGGSTSWRKGKWNFRMGCFVKYASKLCEVRKLSSLISHGVRWEDIIATDSVDQQGKWALNASMASLSHQRLR